MKELKFHATSKPDAQCGTINSAASMTAFVVMDQAGNFRWFMGFHISTDKATGDQAAVL